VPKEDAIQQVFALTGLN